MVRASIRRFLASPLIDAVIRSVVVLGIIGSAFAVAEARDASAQNRRLAEKNQQLTECVANYNNINNQRTKILTEATDAERAATRKADDAQTALFLSPAVGDVSRTPAEQAEVLRLFRAYQKALTDQRKERADADDARRAHPIPDPPSQVCG